MSLSSKNLPGIGGSYKVCPEDFLVEELPLYPCSGKGEHLFVYLEKRGLTTLEMLRRLARTLNIAEREIGYAGLKDAQAITRQWVSIPARCETALAQRSDLPCKVLQSERHGNKLRLGHLAGNRFRILIRNPETGAKAGADTILARLQQQGVPNRFGQQRYGLLGNSHRLGLLLLKKHYSAYIRELLGDPRQIKFPQWQRAAELFRAGKTAAAADALPAGMSGEKKLLQMLISGSSPQAAVLSLPKRLLRLHLSALQAWFFDQLLRQRLPRLERLEKGDLAIKHANGACFLVEDPLHEQLRADQFEISPSAPLIGSKTKLARHRPGEREAALLQTYDIRADDWKLDHGLRMTGERRALRVPINAISTETQGAHLKVDFCLPRGSYATCVLDEVIKPTPTTILPLEPFKAVTST